MNFQVLKNAVAKQFAKMSKHQLYRTAITKDDLWATYLGSFPAGSDPIFRKRTGHDCNCCRQFVCAAGDVVAIIKGKLVSIWDVLVPEEPNYQAVADALSSAVTSNPIESVFLHYERTVGTDKSRELLSTAGAISWDHFFVNVPANFVMDKGQIPTKLGEHRATYDVMFRGLNELTLDSVDTVLDLIAQDSLYRGAEHKAALQSFKALKLAFDAAPDKALFCWSMVTNANNAVGRIRNTAIGTLLIDLSEGKDLEYAVKSFEAKVAPINYKRPTAVVTKAMLKLAKDTIDELGLGSALDRRYATLTDITVPNTLFVNRATKSVLTGNVFDELAKSLPEPNRDFGKVEKVPVAKFVSDILPQAESLEVMFENRHIPNLMSVVAPVDPTALPLFKWGNNFSWDYNGGLADSDIRQAVQARGGRVDGVFRFSHSWNYGKRNTSLMDLHVFMPGNETKAENGQHDNYGNGERVGWNNRSHYKSGGVQDVDYTAPAPVGYIPVENITFPDLARMRDGIYICKIHNWSLRQPTQGGFKAEIEFGGNIYQYEYDKAMGNKKWVTVAEVTLNKGVFTIKHHLPEATSTRTAWGLPTQAFHKVNIAMMSPNHWDGEGVGNRHYFFILDGCKNDGEARGFFNEYLRNDLDKHRKAIELVGSKMKTGSSDNQLSGLGFSSTQRNSVICRVKGKFNRIIEVQI